MRLDGDGVVTVETDMTDIGTGSYTIIAQTAAEMMGVPLDKVVVRLGDSDFPGLGRLRRPVGRATARPPASMPPASSCARRSRRSSASTRPTPMFADGQVRVGQPQRAARRRPPATASSSAEDAIEYGDLAKKHQQSTFGAHFVEVGVDAATGEIRVRRMLAVCAAGRILNPEDRRAAR